MSRTLLLLLALAVAGCTPIPYLPSETSPEQSGDNTAEPSDASAQLPELSPDVPVADSTPPEPERPARQIQPPKSQVLVLRSSDAENYREVAAALSEHLSERYTLHEVDLSDPGIREAATRTTSSGWSAAIAIGEEAAAFAATELDVFTVFCQIFDYQPLLEANDRLFGVEPLPPLKLQLESWRRISPDATTVGLIVSENEAALMDQAKNAATELGLELRAGFAVTDQDAIYQFKRIAQTVDALWLYPSRAILSPGAIREILDYALSHQVQTIVFNKALLEWGALLSVSSNTDDVAATAAAMVDELVHGNAVPVSRMKALTRVEAHLNEETARQLGMPPSASTEQDTELLTAVENDS